jgi:hypothetical protein
MIIIVNGKVVAEKGDTIVLVFETDEQRKILADNLSNMQERNGIRAYASFANGLNGMEIITEAIKKVDPNFNINEAGK